MAFLLEIIKSILFGIVQGITEWLPISSTGHLILLNAVLPLKVFEDTAANEAFWNMYKVVIQFGSILAVVVLYWNKLWPFSKKQTAKEKRGVWRLWILVIIASIPVGLVGILLDDIIDAKLSTPLVVAIALIVYGVLFILIERRKKEPKFKTMRSVDPKTAFFIGCFESLALIPGTSRSGSTIMGSLLLGLSRPLAAEFSFFLAIPAMLGASLLKLIKMDATMNVQAVIILLVGCVVAFAVSVVVIKSLMSYIRKHSFTTFGYYRIVLGIIILILTILHILPSGLSA